MFLKIQYIGLLFNVVALNVLLIKQVAGDRFFLPVHFLFVISHFI